MSQTEDIDVQIHNNIEKEINKTCRFVAACLFGGMAFLMLVAFGCFHFGFQEGQAVGKSQGKLEVAERYLRQALTGKVVFPVKLASVKQELNVKYV